MAGTGGVYNEALPTAADLPMGETRSREEVRCGKTANGIPRQDLLGIGARPEETRP